MELNINKNGVFIQIGTNNGSDEFNIMIKKSKPSKVILVEPNKSLNNVIYRNYSGVENVFLENVAITNSNKGEVELVIPSNIYNGHSKNGIRYGDAGFSLLPMDDWGDEFESIKADSMTFNELCEKYNINHVNFLQIDTEGYDSEIIKSIDFNKVDIDMIKYELWGFDEKCFTRHGDKGKEYGANGMNFVSELLVSLGYELTKLTYDMLAIKKRTE